MNRTVQALRTGAALTMGHNRGIAAGKRAAVLELRPLVEAVRAELRNAHPTWKPTPSFALAWADLQTQMSVLAGDIE